MIKKFLVCICLLQACNICFAGNGQYPNEGEPMENPLMYCVLTILFFGYAKLYQYLLEKFQDKKVLINNIFGIVLITILVAPILLATIKIFIK